MKYFIIIISSLLIISGCAIQGKNTMNYTAPTPLQVQNEIVVPQPYTVVWDKLVKGLSRSFFVINNIDRESRIINISFSTNAPADYIDCGTNHRTYTQGEKVETYDYEVAKSTSFKIATEHQYDPNFSYYSIMKRDTSLEGRSNIYVAPDEKDKNKTLVTVNTRYIYTARVKGDIYSENWGGMANHIMTVPEQTSNVIFNTNKPGELADAGGPGILLVCCGKGRLEKEILDLISQ